MTRYIHLLSPPHLLSIILGKVSTHRHRRELHPRPDAVIYEAVVDAVDGGHEVHVKVSEPGEYTNPDGQVYGLEGGRGLAGS